MKLTSLRVPKMGAFLNLESTQNQYRTESIGGGAADGETVGRLVAHFNAWS